MFHTIKAIILVVMFSGITGTGAYFLYQYKTLDMQNQILQTDLDICNGNGMGLEKQIALQNERITAYNVRTLAMIEAAKQREEELQRVIAWQEEDLATLRNKIGDFHKYTQKAKENDKDFALWTDLPVPATGWRLLRRATTETNSSD